MNKLVSSTFFLFYIWKYITRPAAFTWLEYCRYIRRKTQNNQSINQYRTQYYFHLKTSRKQKSSSSNLEIIRMNNRIAILRSIKLMHCAVYLVRILIWLLVYAILNFCRLFVISRRKDDKTTRRQHDN